MGENSAIEWTTHTFNPWIGCAKVSPGCAHCYAETLVTGRMNRPGTWGDEGTRQRTADSTWKQPLRWERAAERFAAENGGRRQRVFCASLADVFEPRPELEPWRIELFALIEATPSLDWLLLTKRPEEARDWLKGGYANRWFKFVKDPDRFARDWTVRDDLGWGVLPNIWIGTSIENSRFTWRADVLREIPATVRFISAEPLLGSLYEDPHPLDRVRPGMEPAVDDAAEGSTTARGRAPLDLTGIDWLIVGGESGGRDSRPMHPAWVREIRDVCLEYRSLRLDTGEPRPALLFKQWGSWAPRGYVSGQFDVDERPEKIIMGDPKSDEAGRVNWHVKYYGSAPKSGGRVLDGRTWDESPTSLLRSRVGAP